MKKLLPKLKLFAGLLAVLVVVGTGLLPTPSAIQSKITPKAAAACPSGYYNLLGDGSCHKAWPPCTNGVPPIPGKLCDPSNGDCMSGMKWMPAVSACLDPNDVATGPVGTPTGPGGTNREPCPGTLAPAGTDCKTIPPGCPGGPNGPLPPDHNTPLDCTYPPDTANNAGWTCPQARCNFNNGQYMEYGSSTLITPHPENSKDPEMECNTVSSALDWFICPVVKLVNVGVNAMDSAVSNLLEYDANNVKKSDVNGKNYYLAWTSFRNIAFGLIVIAALVMIIGQALGFEMLDAYTLKKLVPRLVIAIIGISLSWTLISWFIILTNDLGFGIRSLIYAPFSNITSDGNVHIGAMGAITWLALPVMAGMGLIALLLYGATAFLALLIGFATLVIRQILITTLIILSPLAIACYVLPNTQNIWKLWHESFSKGLLMFPIIMAFLATGRVFALVSTSHQTPVTEVIGFFAYILPYFLIPVAFRFAGGAMRTIGGFVNDRSRGAFDRLKKGRQNQYKARGAAFKQGFERTKIGSGLKARQQRTLDKISALGSGALPGTARRQADMHSSHMSHLAHGAAEAIKNNPAAAANDEANAAAQGATSRADFIRRYTQVVKPGSSEQEAMQQLTQLEQAYGTTMGSLQMKHTAASAALASNASTDSVQERARWMNEAVENHVMTATQAAALVKQSGSLASSAGFGDLVQAASGTMSGDTLLTKATKGFNPANSQRLRVGQARQMAQEVLRQVEEASYVHELDPITGEIRVDVNGQQIRSRDAAGNHIVDTRSKDFAMAVGDAAGLHDVMNGMTPDVRAEFTKHLNGAEVGGKFVRQHEADLENERNDYYLNTRKTWSTNPERFGGTNPQQQE